MPRNKLQEPEGLPTVYTAGGLTMDTGLLFEQVEHNQYITWDDGELVKEPFITYGKQYLPLDKAAWPLCHDALPYDGKEQLWHRLRQFIYSHLFLPDGSLYDVLTAWVFASWVPELWTTVPYVFFFGPVASGKTRGLEVLHRLCYRGILSSNISSAALFRACEAWHPTIILDETEIYRQTERIDVVGLLNSGYRKGQFAVRAKNTDHGVTLEIFNVFGFKALAGTEGLAAALESRSIMVRMIKNRRPVRLFINEAEARQLRGQLLRWRFDMLGTPLQSAQDKSEWKEHMTTTLLERLDRYRQDWLKDVPALNVESGRIQELFQCLLAVSNSGRNQIIHYAEKVDRMRAFEQKASIEAEVVDILLASNFTLEENVVLTKELAERFNRDRTDRERWKSSSIGRVMRRLGFEKAHTRQGNGWLLDTERLHYLKDIYLGEYSPEPREPCEPCERSPAGIHPLYHDGDGP